MIAIHDLETGEVEVREMNAEELVQYEADQAEAAAVAAAEAAKEAARQVLLDKLGINADEAKLLLNG
jgi:hypothetical protein